MRTSYLNRIVLITEGQMDALIIRTLINVKNKDVYMVAAGGYHNIASSIRVQYLMHGDDYYYIAVFNSNSENPLVQEKRIELVRCLSNANLHRKHIGVFCFHNTLEKDLGIPEFCLYNKEELKKILREKKDTMSICRTIKEIQKFIDEIPN